MAGLFISGGHNSQIAAARAEAPHQSARRQMRHVARLISTGQLDERQARAAIRFCRDPRAWRSSLPPTAWRILHALLVDEAGIEQVEAEMGWSVRSGKVVLGVLLSMMGETTPPPRPILNLERENRELRDQIDFLVGTDDEVVDVMLGFDLTLAPARMLLIMLRAEGRPLTRETLWRRLYSDKPEPDWPDDRIVDVLLSRLRRALDRDGRYEIRTVRGVGYRLIARAGEEAGSARAAS